MMARVLLAIVVCCCLGFFFENNDYQGARELRKYILSKKSQSGLGWAGLGWAANARYPVISIGRSPQ